MKMKLWDKLLLKERGLKRMAVILSVDWDYMIQASTYERATMFPDGGNENIDAGLQNDIWILRYASSIINAEKHGGKIINDIKADDDELEQLYTLIKKHKKSTTKMSLHESHKDITALFTKGKFADSSHDVINIDFHTDCCNTDSDEIHCGNWGKLLSEQGKIDRLYWVKRDDSYDNASGIITDTYCGIQALLDSPAVLNGGIDHIFICRSAVWSPPHLDKYLMVMVLIIKNILNINSMRGLYNLLQRWDDKKTVANIEMLANQIRGIRL